MVLMNSNLILLFLFITPLFGSGGYDHGTSAGKGKWDFSITWNPFNYFEYGQSYIIAGYGLTNRLDIHGYYSSSPERNDNYYSGVSYQFYKSSHLDLSTAIGIRKYRKVTKAHFFLPQLLYTIKLSEKIKIGGSFVEIRDMEENNRFGVASDLFFMIDFYENDKYKIGFSAGAFKPVLWEPKTGDWYPTYSIDIKIK